ncbi:hypothetical protein CRENBAI_023321 [Crenichthys baileyi]|uniref:Uncharacterized protein n=1 Tax=Crenichthys baileyi TaxID=28760 RepID=A0AAV9R5W3_9TELE
MTMMTMNGKQQFSMHPALHEPKYPGLHSGSEGMRRVCLPAPQSSNALAFILIFMTCALRRGSLLSSALLAFGKCF